MIQLQCCWTIDYLKDYEKEKIRKTKTLFVYELHIDKFHAYTKLHEINSLVILETNFKMFI